MPRTSIPITGPRPPRRQVDLHEVLDIAAAELAARVPYDALRQGTTDPESGLIETGHAVGLPRPAMAHLVEAEYGSSDVNKLDWLATRQVPLGLLSTATGGELRRSPRFGALLRPEGLAHELRLALVFRGVCWGYQLIYRSADRPDFSAAELAHARALADGLRADLVRWAGTIPVRLLPAEQPGMIGMIGMDAAGRVDTADDAARQILAGSAVQRCPPTGIPLPLLSFATSLRAGHVRHALLPDPELGWLRLAGNRLRAFSGDQDRFTISVQAATPLSVAPYLLYARGATPRSVAVTLRVLRGMTSAEIAADLGISVHTVQDHLKPVFTALGVRSRRQLIGVLFPWLAPHDIH